MGYNATKFLSFNIKITKNFKNKNIILSIHDSSRIAVKKGVTFVRAHVIHDAPHAMPALGLKLMKATMLMQA